MNSHGHAANGQLTLTYRAWVNMKTRCLNPKRARFNDYGGRGIAICDRWMQFENFLADMGERPSGDHSVDRYPDVNGNYEPSNCRWATNLEQARNKRTTTNITINGETRCAEEWCRLFGINRSTFQSRIKKLGWTDPVKALSTPVQEQGVPSTRIPKPRKRVFLTLDGETRGIDEWATTTGINAYTLRWRAKSGWSDHDTLTKPARPILKRTA